MIVISGSVSRNAMLDLRRMSLRSVVHVWPQPADALRQSWMSPPLLLLTREGQARIKPSSSDDAHAIALSIGWPPCVYLATSLVAIA